MKLEGKIAVVTGASKGIGAGIAKALGAQGATVIVNYACSQIEADAVVAHIIGQGGSAYALQSDMSIGADVVRLFETVKSEHGPLTLCGGRVR
jgi:3-oxoacyl-[acyl-carrier protein] reductase